MWGWVINFFVSAALSYALRPDLEDIEAENDGALVNKQSNIAQIPVIYGERKVGGTRVFVETSGTDNQYLYIALVLCEGVVDGIGDVWINDDLSTDSKFDGLVTINKHLGTDTQTADTTLLSAPSWTSNHRLRGVAYLAIRLKWDREAFGSIPTIQAKVRGRKVYDPRGGGSTGYSTNTALCLLDYLTNTRYGKGLPASSFEPDYQSWQHAADICDAQHMPFGGSALIKTFECNTVIKTDATVMSNVKVFLSGMRGLVPYSQGIYKLIIEKAGSPIFAFNESHIIDGISFSGEKKSDRYNRVIATFVNPQNNWQEDQIEWPPAGSTEYTDLLTEDSGFDLEHRIDLPTITNAYQARNMAKSMLKRSREGIKCNFLSTAEALQLAVGDIVSVTHSTPGWASKHFRVVDLSLQSDGNVAVALSEHQDSTFIWQTGNEVVTIPDTNLPNPYLVSAPTNLAVNSGENYQATNDDGSTSPRVFVSWDASNDSFVDHYIVQVASTNSNWDMEYTTDSSPLYISGVVSGSVIDVRIKAVNSMGNTSAWVTVSNHSIAALVGGSGGVTTFSQNSAPTIDLEIGDLWFNTTGGNNILSRYNGSNWEELQDGTIPTGALADLDVVNLSQHVSGTLGTSNASSSMHNSQISINANGSLANAGSGSVSIGGLGYTGALNATNNTGALADLDVVNLSQHVSGTLGTSNASSSMHNSQISINANGSLANAGSGSVSIGGLGYTGALNATNNTGTLADLDEVGSGQINVSKLSDINSNVGTMTAGTINVGSGEISIVGGTIGGSRIEIDNEALKVYEGSTLRVTIGKL